MEGWNYSIHVSIHSGQQYCSLCHLQRIHGFLTYLGSRYELLENMSLMPLVYEVSGAKLHAHWAGILLTAGLPALPRLRFLNRADGKAVSTIDHKISREADADRLCAFIHETTKLDPHRKPGQQLAMLVQSIFKMEAVAIFDDDLQEVYRAGDWFDDVQDVLQNICIFDTVSDDEQTGLSRRVLHMGNLPIGAMIVRGETRGLLASGIAEVVAITFDRYHSLANESRTESARQVEQLRTTVLDSLAHAYKTPLTVIGTASEGLNAIGNLSVAQAGLVALIDEQAALLGRLTTRLLKTARLQASDMTPHAQKVAVSPLVEDVVASLRDSLSAVGVKVVVAPEDLSIRCDRSLLVALLTQYVDNAAKYGLAGTTVTIQASEHAAEVIFTVHSFGPVIPAHDFERIFDRYYRSSAPSNRAPGTGIGLSVAKRTAQAQGGHVWVTSDAERGTTFYASLPTVPQGSASL
jgi:two-component system sensor histidine kinase KdpD